MVEAIDRYPDFPSFAHGAALSLLAPLSPISLSVYSICIVVGWFAGEIPFVWSAGWSTAQRRLGVLSGGTDGRMNRWVGGWTLRGEGVASRFDSFCLFFCFLRSRSNGEASSGATLLARSGDGYAVEGGKGWREGGDSFIDCRHSLYIHPRPAPG